MARNVILLKAKADGGKEDKYNHVLEPAGFSVKIIAPIDFEFCNLYELANRLQDPHSYSGLILSSPRCLKAVTMAVKIAKVDMAPWMTMPTFVVGEATDADASSIGLKTEGKECGNAMALAKYIIKCKLRKELLYPKGNLAEDAILKRLSASDLVVDSVEVYRTIPHTNLDVEVENILKNLPTKVVFFSPSGVKSFLPLFKRHQLPSGSIEFYAIGETTKKALIAGDLPVSGTAKKPNPEGLLEAINAASSK